MYSRLSYYLDLIFVLFSYLQPGYNYVSLKSILVPHSISVFALLSVHCRNGTREKFNIQHVKQRSADMVVLCYYLL